MDIPGLEKERRYREMVKGGVDFSKISNEYEKRATIQKEASKKLLELLSIKKTDDVLDLGCGPGHITKEIRAITSGDVFGVDPSEGMIKKAREKNRDLDIVFEIKSAEELDYIERFDVIFSNSAFQWFKDPKKAMRNCYRALRKGGKIGIQAPAKKMYSPNFIEVINEIKKNKKTKDIFSHFRNPWFFLETERDYKLFFEECGFQVNFVKILRYVQTYPFQKVYDVFAQGAMAGYLNQDYYDIPLNEDYITSFKEIVKRAFEKQANNSGMVKLVFNRVFIIGIKSD